MKYGVRIIGTSIIFESKTIADARRQALDSFGACTIEYWRLDGSGGGVTKAKP
jgi:hypothetical protein